jgi:dynein heavy chain 2, cytosolic
LKGKVSAEILDTAEQGKRYYKEALSLKKIAHFYNNMGEEIIDSQRAMVLKELQTFEECVRNVNSEMGAGGELTWDKPANVEKYIDNLSRATTKLLR